MADTVFMDIPKPTPGGDDGTWGVILNNGADIIDAHDHTAGKGVLVPVAGLNINADLPFNSNKATQLKAAQFTDVGTAPSGVSNANQTQAASGDLWFTNGSGVPVQITSGSSTVAPSTSNTPPGIVLPYAGSSAPAGYLMSDGSAVSRVTYSALFGAIGTTFGPGDGSTTFNLPALMGRAPMGAGTYTDSVSGSITRTLGQQIGAEKHVLVTAELATHTHAQTAHNHDILGGTGSTPIILSNPGTAGVLGVDGVAGVGNYFSTANANGNKYVNDTTAVNQNTGSNTAHNNMQPSLGLNFIIKT